MQKWSENANIICRWSPIGAVLLVLGLTGCSGFNYKLTLPFYTPDNSNNIYFKAGVKRPPQYNPYYLNQIADDTKKKKAQQSQEQEEEDLDADDNSVAVRDMVDAEGTPLSPLANGQQTPKKPLKRRVVPLSSNNNGDPGDVMPTSLPAKAPPILPVYGSKDSGIIQLPTGKPAAPTARTIPAAPPTPAPTTSASAPSTPAVSDTISEATHDPDLSVLDMGLTETR